MAGVTRVVLLALAGVVVLATGVVLTRAERPYGAALLNVHKLVDLAAVVAIGVAIYQANRAAPFSAGAWAVVIAAAVLVVATFASGGVISAMDAPPAGVLWLHRIGSWVAAALVAASAYLALR
jgi:hypothetical protein